MKDIIKIKETQESRCLVFPVAFTRRVQSGLNTATSWSILSSEPTQHAGLEENTKMWL